MKRDKMPAISNEELESRLFDAHYRGLMFKDAITDDSVFHFTALMNQDENYRRTVEHLSQIIADTNSDIDFWEKFNETLAPTAIDCGYHFYQVAHSIDDNTSQFNPSEEDEELRIFVDMEISKKFMECFLNAMLAYVYNPLLSDEDYQTLWKTMEFFTHPWT